MSSTQAAPEMQAPAERVEVPQSATRRALEIAGPFGVPIMTIALIVYFGVTAHGFLTGENLQNVAATAALPAVCAVGLTIPLVMGQYDLSIAACAGLATIVFSVMVARNGMNPVLGFILSFILVGVLVGVVNGTLVAYVGLNALVATIAMQSILNGLQFYVSGNQNIFGGYPQGLVDFTRGKIGPIPTLAVVAGVIVVLAWILLEKTRYGRHVKAVGGNREASRLVGINVRRTEAIGFLIAASLAALAGILFANRQSAAYPLSGLDVLLPSFTAAFIGAATFRFGEFNIFGTVVGVAIVTITANGLSLSGVPNYATYVFQGLILLVALIFARVVALRRAE